MKKAGKTTRPFRYDLNQIPKDYRVEVRNIFKAQDLIDCLMNYRQRFMTLYKRQGADCGSGNEILIAKFRLKLKKVGKITRPFRYDLNQIPYDDTVEVSNRFKGLDLIDRVPDEL